MSLEGGYHEVLSYSFAHGPTVERLDEEGQSGLALATRSAQVAAYAQESSTESAQDGLERTVAISTRLSSLRLGAAKKSLADGAQPRRVQWVGIYEGEPTPAERYLIEQRAAITRLLDSLNYTDYRFVAGVHGFDYEARWMHPHRSLTIEVDGQTVGYLGTLHPRPRDAFRT